MTYYQVITRDPHFGWAPLGEAVYINTEDMQAADVANARELTKRIIEHKDGPKPVAMLDGVNYETVMAELMKLNMGYRAQGFPADEALELMSRLVGMHPLETGIPGDHDKPYRAMLPVSTDGIRVLVRENKKWKNAGIRVMVEEDSTWKTTTEGC